MTRASHLSTSDHIPTIRKQILTLTDNGSSPLVAAFGEWYQSLDDDHQCTIEREISEMIYKFKTKCNGRKFQFSVMAAMECMAAIIAIERGWIRTRQPQHSNA